MAAHPRNPLTSPVPAPWHLWPVGVVSLLWNSIGCYDYMMTRVNPVDHMGRMGLSAEAIAYMQALPVWLGIFWALGVWGSFAGSILLLLRSRHAVAAFVVSLVGLAVSQGYQWTGGMPAEMQGLATVIMAVLIWAGLVFLLWYASRMKARGVLR